MGSKKRSDTGTLTLGSEVTGAASLVRVRSGAGTPFITAMLFRAFSASS